MDAASAVRQWVTALLASLPAAAPPAAAAGGTERLSSADIVSKVSGKVLAEWGSKSRSGIRLQAWLSDNPKRRQQAALLIKEYQRRLQRGQSRQC